MNEVRTPPSAERKRALTADPVYSLMANGPFFVMQVPRRRRLLRRRGRRRAAGARDSPPRAVDSPGSIPLSARRNAHRRGPAVPRRPGALGGEASVVSSSDVLGSPTRREQIQILC